MEIMILDNGLKVIYEKMPNTHSITVALYVKSGSRYEIAEQRGMTHLLEHVHFRRLDDLSQKELYYAMESIGSTLRGSTYRDFLKFSMMIRPVYLKQCLEIFGRFFKPINISEDEFQQEMTVVINQIKERDSCFRIEPMIRKAIWGGMNLSEEIMGNEETVAKITISDLAKYKDREFNSNNMYLCITGCITDADLNFIKEVFSNLHINCGKENIPDNEQGLQHKRTQNILIENVDWEYLDIAISFDLDYAYTAFTEYKLLNCILGEGVGSRLPVRIREELGYTASIYSEIEAYENEAVLNIKFTVYKELVNDCLREIVHVLNEMRQDINERDLKISLPFYTENLMLLQDDTEEMNFQLAYHRIIFNEDFSRTGFTTSIESQRRLAQHIFRPENASVVLLGKCNKITKKKIKEILMQLDEKA